MQYFCTVKPIKLFVMNKSRAETVKFLKQLVKVVQDDVYFSDSDFFIHPDKDRVCVGNFLSKKIYNFFNS